MNNNYQKKAQATIAARQKDARARFLEALKQIPVIGVACSKSGISRATYHRWRDGSKTFAVAADAAKREGIDFVNDMGESQLIRMIQEQNWPALSFWLKHRHPDYTSKLEIKAEVTTAPEELTAEQRRTVARALSLATLVESDDKASVKKRTNHKHE